MFSEKDVSTSHSVAVATAQCKLEQSSRRKGDTAVVDEYYSSRVNRTALS